MYYWIHKIEDENGSPENVDPATSWLPIQLDSPVINAPDETSVFIHFGAISVEVRSGANMNVVSDVLNLLREPRSEERRVWIVCMSVPAPDHCLRTVSALSAFV